MGPSEGTEDIALARWSQGIRVTGAARAPSQKGLMGQGAARKSPEGPRKPHTSAKTARSADRATKQPHRNASQVLLAIQCSTVQYSEMHLVIVFSERHNI